MMKDQNMEMAKLEDADLGAVAGGTEIYEGITAKDNTANVRRLRVLAGQDAAETAQTMASAPATGPAQGASATAYCPVCGKRTEFLVVSGGRAFCKVCGTAAEL